MESKKTKQMNKHRKTETESQVQRTNRRLPGGWGEGGGEMREIKRYRIPGAK